MLKFFGLKKYSYIAKYIPIAVMTIQTIEEIMQGEDGKEKKKAVMDYISDLLEKQSPLGKKEREQVLEFVDSSVDFFVMLFNKRKLWFGIGKPDTNKVKGPKG